MELFQTIFNWLLLPLSGASLHDIAPHVAWHARLMVLAWSVLIPLGILIARFCKVTPWQDFPRVTDYKFWWHLHRGLQYTGVLVAIVAVSLVWQSNLTTWHAMAGYGVLLLGLLQILGGFLRGTKGGPTDVAKGLPERGDHFDMTRRRRIFEWCHKRFGYAALALTLVATMLGLVLADAPHWMVLVISLWWVLLACLFIWLQKQGRAIDTYTAIWGKPYKEMHASQA